MKAPRVFAALTAALFFLSCRSPAPEPSPLLPAEEPAPGIGAKETLPAAGEVYDLTGFSDTMLYVEIGHINAVPEEYAGRVIRMTGVFSAHPARNGMQFVCGALDAAGCCVEPMEFVLEEERLWPDEYPAEGETITVQGTLETYSFHESMTYCRLVGAVIENGD